MKKITALATLTAAGLALAGPAHAHDGDHGRINIAGRTLSGNKICQQALGLVPFVVPETGQSVYDACNNAEHGGRAQPQHGHQEIQRTSVESDDWQ
ncbi:hypothetical protein AQI95_15915 [Streptomyces yokosukanensis]|uniref:Chaplin domain-containing protein n=1 Tax=Streptomyces yokosukanensis TaxID=67386 RepID=A0A101P5Q9_9ACTN|nr:hypothetical protein [Streptomyces yokosukanensis]KUN05418.1 hypothetical protein AQI95_15915 [Streptomyces yokosukanensis]